MKSCIDFYDDSISLWVDEWYKNDKHNEYFKKVLKHINNKNPRVLDLCCGAGYESMRLKALGADVVGIDLSQKSIEVAKEKNPYIDFYVKDMLKPYTDLGKFDCIVCIAGIIHIKENDLDIAFKNMYDVLNPNGYLLLVFREGEGERETSTFNNEVYARNFIYYTKEKLNNYMSKYFEFIEDISKEEDNDWKYFIYKKIN